MYAEASLQRAGDAGCREESVPVQRNAVERWQKVDVAECGARPVVYRGELQHPPLAIIIIGLHLNGLIRSDQRVEFFGRSVEKREFRVIECALELHRQVHPQ